ncbi:MAG: hypothetical protein JRJ44_06320 [Deltaproteobacteria bacterium]|nr:hypothetical protein [Deltaproteobacteria bacterium]
MDLYNRLKKALEDKIKEYNLSGQNISIRCKILSASEAIGKPSDEDYPIIKGKEVMVEAVFKGAKGQAFTEEFENTDYSVEDLLKISLNSNKKRASFIAALNAIFRHLKLCDKTVHCKDNEPKECACGLSDIGRGYNNILLIGYQPRFLEALIADHNVRVLDMDNDNIGSKRFGILIESPDITKDAVKWSDLIFATGSTIVNGTIDNFINKNKPVTFYGVTISAAAKILNLKTYCYCGH